MATPHAEDVPTARTGAIPRHTSSGTVMLPPPMPTTADTAPIPAPAAVIGQPRGAMLNKFLSDPNMKPFGTNVMPEQVILNNLVSKFSSSNGELYRSAIVALDRRGMAGEFRNFGFVNAEQTLLDAIPEADRESFRGAWTMLDYSDQEACLTLVRDAALGGIADL